MNTARFRIALIAVVLLGAGCRPNSEQPPAEANSSPVATTSVRAPVVAGSFYPADPEQLRAKVSTFLALAKPPALAGDIIGLMAPHAGYDFSGGVAGYAFKAIQDREYDTVILIGPSHRQTVPTGAALSSHNAWQTPLGTVPVDVELRQQLLAASDRFNIADGPHAYEHCLEVELPFLQTVLSDFKILPIVMTDFSKQNTAALAEALVQVVSGRKVLIVASTDMSHYPAAAAEAQRVDTAMLKAIATLDPDEVYAADEKLLGEGVADLHCTLCGLGPLVVTMKVAQALGADRAEVLRYSNSAQVEPQTATRCVGYGAVAFVGTRRSGPVQGEAEASPKPTTEELNEAQQQFLLKLARSTITEHLATGHTAPCQTEDPVMHEQRAVFVTLHKAGQLRGCIGQLVARAPLIEAVQDAAISAATQDPRFPPVTSNELGEIDIEISVLSPLTAVDDPETIEVGKHGVLVIQGSRQGVFLPQVAVEQGWDRETMLTELCAHKAGLAPDAWKGDATLYVFTAQVFGEHEAQ